MIGQKLCLVIAGTTSLAKTTCITVARNTLHINGDSTHPCRSPCVTSNDSQCSPSSVRPQARLMLWNWRITFGMLADTPKRVSTCHSSSRSTESYAYCRSMEHMHKEIFLSSSCNRRTTNSMSTVDRAGRRIVPQGVCPDPQSSC